MDENDPFALPPRRPTPGRPLLGLTVLVVEDSRFASEAMRLLCLRSGARIRRADCLRSAKRHLQVYSPSVAIIDIGLRDGSGADLIRELTAGPQSTVILGMSGDPDGEAIAMDAGADGFLTKPVTSLAAFQQVILSHLPDHRRPNGLRLLPDETVSPDPIAYQDDLAHMADILDTEQDGETVDYVAQFLGGVAKSADDEALMQAARALAAKRRNGGPTGSEMARLAGLVQERLEHRIAM